MPNDDPTADMTEAELDEYLRKRMAEPKPPWWPDSKAASHGGDRDVTIRKLRAAGTSIGEICEAFGLSRGRVYKITGGAKEVERVRKRRKAKR